MFDKDLLGRLRDARRVKKKAGQEFFRLTRTDSATSSPVFSSTNMCGAAPSRPRLWIASGPGRTGDHGTALRSNGDHLGGLDISSGAWGVD